VCKWRHRVSGARVKTCERFCVRRQGAPLRLVTQALLMPVELHALAALVLGNFGFAFLFN